VGIGGADAHTYTTSKSHANVGSSGHSGWVIAGGNFVLEALNDPHTAASAKAGAGGFVGVASGDGEALITYETTAAINNSSSVLALGLAKVSAHTSGAADSHAEASGGGFGADGNTDSNAQFNGTNTASLGDDASLIGDRTIMSAKGENITAHASADGRGAGFVGVGDADADVDVHMTNLVSIGARATLTGWEGVDLLATFDHINDANGNTGDAYARSTGLFGHVEADAHNNTELTSSVVGAAHALVTAGPRDPSDPDLAHVSGFDQLTLYIDTKNGVVNTHTHAHASKRSLATG